MRRIPIPRLAFASLALLVFAAHAVDAAACGEVKHSSAKAVPHKVGRPPLEIGDSTSILGAPKLARLGIEADAHGCRQFNQGVSIMSSRRHNRTLPRIVILALGANGPIPAAQMKRALKIMGHDRILVLVTPPKAGGSASLMRRTARRHPDRVLLIDWARRSAGRGWFDGDGLHPDYNGATQFARMIKRGVAPYAFPPMKKLDLPKSAPKQKSCGIVRQGVHRYRVYVLRGTKKVGCAGARMVVRRPPLKRTTWTAYDVRGAGRWKWQWSYVGKRNTVLIGAAEA